MPFFFFILRNTVLSNDRDDNDQHRLNFKSQKSGILENQEYATFSLTSHARPPKLCYSVCVFIDYRKGNPKRPKE